MKNDDVRCSSQTPQHVLLSHVFRDIRLDARIHQIELVIIRKHLKFVCEISIKLTTQTHPA